MSLKDQQRAGAFNTPLQQAGLADILGGGTGQAGGGIPPTPSTVEGAQQRIAQLVAQHADIIANAFSIVERMNGASAQNDKVSPEQACAAGQLNELHRMIEVLENQTRELTNVLDNINHVV